MGHNSRPITRAKPKTISLATGLPRDSASFQSGSDHSPLTSVRTIAMVYAVLPTGSTWQVGSHAPPLGDEIQDGITFSYSWLSLVQTRICTSNVSCHCSPYLYVSLKNVARSETIKSVNHRDAAKTPTRKSTEKLTWSLANPPFGIRESGVSLLRMPRTVSGAFHQLG